MIYPLKMHPYYRHGTETPWGGDMLRTLYGKNIPDALTGESLEISALPGKCSVVANGEYEGRTLLDMLAIWGDALTGRQYDEFPLLLKLLDAKRTLSVQVHPDNDYSRAHENKLGKEEAWYILHTEPGARLVYGVNSETREDLQRAMDENDIESQLNWIDVQPGDCLFIRHGVVHAVGGGIVLYEIQQSSDVTYRFYDWGSTRELHKQKALDVTALNIPLSKVVPQVADVPGGTIATLAQSDYFTLYQLDVNGEMTIDAGMFSMFTALGDGAIAWDGGEMSVVNGESVLIPAGLGKWQVKGTLRALMSKPGAKA